MLDFIKENFALSILIIYLIIISILSVIICIYDKVISKKNDVRLRIPEKTLLILSALGGSVAMYICMHIIRHKTKHFKFMVGIPIIIIIQVIIIFLLFHFNIF